MTAKLGDLSVEIGSKVEEQYSDNGVAAQVVADVAMDVLMDWLVGPSKENEGTSALRVSNPRVQPSRSINGEDLSDARND